MTKRPAKRTPAKGPKSPTDVDRHIGVRLREIRKELGLSQSKLGDTCGLSFQQVQKYEGGKNRLSVSRLLEFARHLNRPITDFLPDGEKR